MPSRFDSRVKRLEEKMAAPWQGHKPGVLTVKLAGLETHNGRFFKEHGWDIERIYTAADRDAPLDFREVMAAIEQEKALREKLKGLSREEQERLAKRHGFRVIYPDSLDSVRSAGSLRR